MIVVLMAIHDQLFILSTEVFLLPLHLVNEDQINEADP